MTVTEPTTDAATAHGLVTDVDDVVVAHDDAVLVDDVLVEEISIDGMCGVY